MYSFKAGSAALRVEHVPLPFKAPQKETLRVPGTRAGQAPRAGRPPRPPDAQQALGGGHMDLRRWPRSWTASGSRR